MRVAVVGGGPAGLFFALLLKRVDAAHEVSVFERDARASTFGFGICLADLTMTLLGRGDAATWELVRPHLTTWEGLEVVHRGETVHVQGGRLSGIARSAFVGALRQRCLEAGVDLRFGTRVAEPVALAAAHDLLVGADGAASRVREAFADGFRPTLDERPSRFIWYGTKHVFPRLRHIFRQTEHGPLVASCYPFAPDASTFIIECEAETWRRAGFDRLDARATRRRLEEVFRDDLEGRPLVSNRSRWASFAVVRNQRWSHQNVVLLGDAAHTVHYSLGAGTRLALQDAMVCLRHVVSFGLTPAALARYEEFERPEVEHHQLEADRSIAWFEALGAAMNRAPAALAESLVERCGGSRAS
jgi:anthraniloyl-CoA monooxygenase